MPVEPNERTSRRRIVVGTDWIRATGTTKRAAALAAALGREGWDVRLLTPSGECVPCDAIDAIAAPRHHGEPRSRWRFRDVARALHRASPDVLITAGASMAVTGRLAAVAARVPVVVSWMRDVGALSRRQTATLRATRALATATVVAGAGDARPLLAARAASARRLHVIPDAVDAAHLVDAEARRGATRDAFQVAPDAWLWLTAGPLEAAQNVPLVVRAFARLRTNRPADRLFIVGEGGRRAEIERTIRAAGASDACRLLGHRGDLSQLVPASDGVVFAGMEGCALDVLLDAMVSGVPAVAPDAGRAAEVMAGMRASLAVQPDDEAAMLDAMRGVVERSPAKRREMAEQDRAEARARFAPSSVYEAWAALIDSLCRHG